MVFEQTKLNFMTPQSDFMMVWFFKVPVGSLKDHFIPQKSILTKMVF